MFAEYLALNRAGIACMVFDNVTFGKSVADPKKRSYICNFRDLPNDVHTFCEVRTSCTRAHLQAETAIKWAHVAGVFNGRGGTRFFMPIRISVHKRCLRLSLSAPALGAVQSRVWLTGGQPRMCSCAQAGGLDHRSL